jgi:FkbM family methyltransferase
MSLKLIKDTNFYVTEESSDIHYQYIKREIFDLLVYDFHLCSLPRRGVVLDIGANIGLFAFYAITKKNNYVYCFEPALNCLPALYKNLEPYKYSYRVIEKGVWSSENKLNFFEYNEFSGCNQILELANDETRQIEVITIDKFVSDEKLGQVDFIKVDVEGADLEVLKGATETIKKFKPRMALSVYHKRTDEKNIIEFVESLNLDYNITVLNHTKIGIKLAYCY